MNGEGRENVGMSFSHIVSKKGEKKNNIKSCTLYLRFEMATQFELSENYKLLKGMSKVVSVSFFFGKSIKINVRVHKLNVRI